MYSLQPHLLLLTGEVMGGGLCAGGEGRHVGVEAAAPQTRREVVIVLGAAVPRAPHRDAGLARGVIVPGLNIDIEMEKHKYLSNLAIFVCLAFESAVCPLLDGSVCVGILGISKLFLQSRASVKHS